MPYAHPEDQPPHGRGYYAAPQQMITSQNFLQEVASFRQCQMPYEFNWVMNPRVWPESNLNFAQGMIPPVLPGDPPNAMGQHESDGSSAAYYSESDDDDDTTMPRVPPKDMETCPFSLTYP